MPSFTSACFRAARTPKSPHPGHHEDLMWLAKSFKVSRLPDPSRRPDGAAPFSDVGGHLLKTGRCDLLGREGPAVELVNAVGDLVPRAHEEELRELAGVILLDGHGPPGAFQGAAGLVGGERPVIGEVK